MRLRFVFLVLVCACSGCAHVERIEVAFDAVREGSLIDALVQLDAVPPSDPRYPEARATADAVERRVRVAHRLMQQAFDLRAQRRDDLAAATIAAARAIWPSLPGIDALATATAARMDAVRVGSRDETGFGEVLSTNTMVDTPGSATPAGETARAEDAAADPSDWLQVERAAERLLGQGRVDQAIVLIESARASGCTAESTRLWLTAIRNRARTVYSRGDLSAAALAWQRVLDVQAQDVEATGFLEAIRAEQSWRSEGIGAHDGPGS